MTVANPNVHVVDVSPSTVNVRIEPITTRPVAVQVRFANNPPAGKTRPARPHQKPGTYKQYGCFFRYERVLYTATYVPDAPKTSTTGG